MLKFMKKFFMVVLLAALVLVGCGGAKEPAAATGPVELRISWWGGDSRHTATLNAIKLFQEQNPNITVKGEYAGYSGFQEKLTTQIAGGTAPDVMQLNWNWVVSFSPDGNGFADLNTFKDTIQLDNFKKEDLDYGTVNGKLNAIPVSQTGRVMYLNKSTYDKFGVAIPETWDDYFAAAEKFDEGYYPFDLDILNNSVWLMIITYIEQQTGKPFITEDNKIGFSEADIQMGFEFYQTLVDKKVVPSIKERAGEGGKVELYEMPNYLNGKYAGVYEWTSSAAKYAKPITSQGQEMVLANLPKGTADKSSGVIAKPSLLWAISKTTKYPKESAMLMEFLLNDEAAAKELGLERGVPLSTSTLSVLEKEGKLNGLEYEGTKFVRDNVDLASSPYFEDSSLQAGYRSATEKFGYGEMTAAEAAAEIHKLVTEKLASV